MQTQTFLCSFTYAYTTYNLENQLPISFQFPSVILVLSLSKPLTTFFQCSLLFWRNLLAIFLPSQLHIYWCLTNILPLDQFFFSTMSTSPSVILLFLDWTTLSITTQESFPKRQIHLFAISQSFYQQATHVKKPKFVFNIPKGRTRKIHTMNLIFKQYFKCSHTSTSKYPQLPKTIKTILYVAT